MGPKTMCQALVKLIFFVVFRGNRLLEAANTKEAPDDPRKLKEQVLL